MKFFTKLTILLGCAVVLAAGCIKETQPTNIATTEQIAESSSALDAIVGAIPTQMVQGYLVYGEQDWEFDFAYPALMIILDSAAGEIIDSGDTGYDWFSYWSSNAYSLGPNAATAYVPWRTSYMFIKSANDVIAAINPEEATELQLQYLGRALAVRSFVYLMLAQIYEYKAPTDSNVDAKYSPSGNIQGLTVPIVTEKTTEEEGKANPRAQKDDLYAMIMGDLEAAEEYLESTSSSSPSLLPTLAVTYGIHAKAFLALEQYAEAAEYADKAIQKFGGSPLTQTQWEDPINGFNNSGANSNSWMWYLAYSPENMGNLCNFVGHMSAEATWTSYAWAVGRGINKNVYDRIPDSDWRKHSWIDPQGEDYYKYKTNRNVFDEENKPLGPYTNLKFRPGGGDYATYKVGGATHVPVMRIEEMYFIKAEGLAMSGKLGEAKEFFNSFMRTRNPEYDCSSITVPTSFQSELIFQKRVEFWGEGIIFYDFKRLGSGIKNGYTDTNVQGGYRYNVDGVAPWWNWVIPQQEINGNPVIDGYNNPDPTKSVVEWK